MAYVGISPHEMLTADAVMALASSEARKVAVRATSSSQRVTDGFMAERFEPISQFLRAAERRAMTTVNLVGDNAEPIAHDRA